MADLETKFNEASDLISKGSKEELVPAAAEDKLKLYGLFKQAKEGDNTASAPLSVQWETKAKWDAWEKNKGKSKEAAMTEYIAEVEVQKEKFGILPPCTATRQTQVSFEGNEGAVKRGVKGAETRKFGHIGVRK
ncbi:putative acyl-CoA-binding protein [Symbiodinium microadriaticum]|uniref:Putative acyl-CoA-binding protein n=1 Tax=Symbiodinium microadriaticum TaxID=2951 RepID=A0A1Q9BTU5_SYMMI|nr:putative acyl-CoA-binding protein [Symbiodinium microadriaticum]